MQCMHRQFLETVLAHFMTSTDALTPCHCDILFRSLFLFVSFHLTCTSRKIFFVFSPKALLMAKKFIEISRLVHFNWRLRCGHHCFFLIYASNKSFSHRESLEWGNQRRAHTHKKMSILNKLAHP